MLCQPLHCKHWDVLACAARHGCVRGAPPADSGAPPCMRAEIGATAVHPADVTMRRGIMMGYVTIVCAYLAVSITGAAC